MEGPLKLTPGSIFAGDFRIVGPLGAGGMGAVYVAEQLSTSTRRALKLMRAELSHNERARARFVREARVSGRIKSEHVVQVVGAGIDSATDIPWLAMELLEGEDLGSFMRRKGALATWEVAAIFTQIGHALAAAHEAGVVHRDLKPENVFIALTHHAKVPVSVKVLDFGIARLLDSSAATTNAIGTPLWMSPEQTDVRGEVTAASDIWALGLIAFRALTGHHYYRGGDSANTPVHALLRQTLIDRLPSASERAAELACADALPPAFDNWFEKSVCREIDERFASVRQQMEALQEALGKPDIDRSLDVIPSFLPAALPSRSKDTEPSAPLTGGAVLGEAPTEAVEAAMTPGGPPLTLHSHSVTKEVESIGAQARARRRWTRAVTAGVALILVATVVVVFVSSRPSGAVTGTVETAWGGVSGGPTAVASVPSAPAPPPTSASALDGLSSGCSSWQQLISYKATTITNIVRLCREGTRVTGEWKRNSPKSGFLSTELAGSVDDNGTLTMRETRIIKDDQTADRMRCFRTFSLSYYPPDQLIGTSVTITSGDSDCRHRKDDHVSLVRSKTEP